MTLKKKKLLRSRVYPAKTVKKTIEILSGLSVLYGKGKISDDTALGQLQQSKRTASYSYAKSAAIQYGLIVPVDKRYFEITDYGESYFSGTSTDYSKLLTNPQLYKMIFDKYPNNNWNDDEDIKRIMSNYGVIPSKIELALTVFYDNVQESKSTILSLEDDVDPSNGGIDKNSQIMEAGDASMKLDDSSTSQRMEITLGSGDITLTVPKNITSSDSEMVSGMIELFLKHVQKQ